MYTSLPSPKEYFGFEPGSDRHMIRWDKLCGYYHLADSVSDRVKLTEVGLSSEGNPFLILYVSSAENLRNLEKYRRISMSLADPRGQNKDALEEQIHGGKAVCFQSYGLHSNEVGGPQAVPGILYELVSAQDGELLDVLDNVIFIISPCSEPDGEIIFTDWYNKYLGTRHEGICSPYLRHNWAGHSNNRDAMREILAESHYLNDILIRTWMPQIFQDHHHQCPDEERMSIAPFSDPLYEPYCPIVQRETSLYGAHMATALAAAGRRGVVSGDKRFNSFPISTFYGTGSLHNIAGMLTENADVRIATPVVIHPDSYRGLLLPTAVCPDPWSGGEWHLSDIVEQIRIASLSLLKYAAHNREDILRRMVMKAEYQTERGKKSVEQAYIFPTEQHDPSAMRTLLGLLENQRVDMYCAARDFVSGGRRYGAGSVIVPLAQPKYAVVKAFLDASPYPVGTSPRNPDGSVRVTDTANLSMALCMGVQVLTADEPLPDDLLAPYTAGNTPCSLYTVKDTVCTFPLPGNENESYRLANAALADGTALWRSADGSFHKESAPDRLPIRRAVVGLLKKSATWNEEEGYTRSLLRMYGFDYRIVMDKEIRENGVPADLDVLILPGDRAEELRAGEVEDPNYPVEYRRGVASAGGRSIQEFVRGGGRLIAWEKSWAYANTLFSLGIRDRAESLQRKDYSTNGSQLAAEIVPHPLTAGMPRRFTLTHSDGPIFRPMDTNGRVEVLARFVERPYVNGYVVGEQHLSGTPCMLRAPFGKGDILLYTFNPEFRVQQEGTFKLLFNAMFLPI